MVSLWDFGKRLSLNIDNSKRKKRFNAEVKYSKHGCFLLFASGKCVATGFKSFKRMYQDMTITFEDPPRFVKLYLITAKTKLPFRFDFIKMTKNHKNTSFEPELYPALYWRDGKICICCYDNGSIVITGATCIGRMKTVLKNFYEVARKYKRIV
ncbi:TATA box-binding protein-like 2 [Panonychus citri]|uniref:TATA box-binding protein-like 2 n=1 Tax=Panonychus citri TaxID=50023 RepID=UPI002306E47C|nr:TATA box-binding protein-like 2 [Panonychus citri]